MRTAKISDSLHHRLNVLAVKNRIPLQDFVSRLLEWTLNEQAKNDDVTLTSHNNRGLTLKVYFYGDVAGKDPAPVVPKVFWEGGRVFLVRNDLHGIEPKHSLPFNHATDLLWKINCLLRDHGIEVLKPRTVQTMRQLESAGVTIAK